MKSRLFLFAIVFFMVQTVQAQEVNERHVEVTGTSEIEIMPDKIHYIIEISEYFKKEFDGKSKPEEYHTKVPLSQMIAKKTCRGWYYARCNPYTRDWRLLAKARAGLFSIQAI